MVNFFITATNTDIGKTYTALHLIRELNALGHSTLACKPIETGVTKEPHDARLLLEANKKHNKRCKDLEIEDICFYQYPLPAAPYVAKDGPIEIERIKKKIKKLHKLADVLLIEGAGGLLVPIEREYFMIDLAKDLDAHPILIASSRLGEINTLLLSMEALKHRGMEHSFCINMHRGAKEFPKISRPYLKERFEKIYELPKESREFAQMLMAKKT